MSRWEIIAIAVTIMLGGYMLLIACGKRLAYMRETHHPAVDERQWPKPTFDDMAVREQLRMLIDQYGITGSCDIRNGEVRAAVVPGQRSSTAHALMGVYNQAVSRTKNPNLMLYTQQDGVLIPLGLELSTLYDVAELLEKSE